MSRTHTAGSVREHGRRGAVQSPRSTLLVLACGTALACTDFGGISDFATALAIQADGRIVVAGVTDQGLNPDNFALARFEGGEPPPPPPEEPPLKCKDEQRRFAPCPAR